jgi:hypothetical protein
MNLDLLAWRYVDPRKSWYSQMPGPQRTRPPRYITLVPWPDLCGTAIAEAVIRGLPLAKVYDLHVNPVAVYDARAMIHEWTGRYPNPVAPLVNVIPDPKLTRFEWFIEGGGMAIGSPGC